jgi:hypothetical protein
MKDLIVSKLGEAPENVEKHGHRQFRKLYQGSKNADAFCSGGCNPPK